MCYFKYYIVDLSISSKLYIKIVKLFENIVIIKKIVYVF